MLIFNSFSIVIISHLRANDGVDTEKGESEIAPFLNILNEMHARQTSKKVKAAIKTRFLSGAYAPIGYKKHPEIKGKLIPDEETRYTSETAFTTSRRPYPSKTRKRFTSQRKSGILWKTRTSR